MPMRPINLVRSPDGLAADGPANERTRAPAGAAAPAGGDPFAELKGSGRMVTMDRQGRVIKVINLGSLPNGMVHLGKNVYLVADSVDAVIYRIDMNQGAFTTWLADDRFKFVTGGGRGPGVNGAKLMNRTLYLANSSAGVLYKIAVGRDGKPAGDLIKVADVKEADDFDVGRDGTVYVATHGPIVKVAPDGKTAELTDGKQVPGGPALMLARDGKSLYVVTDQVPGGPFLLRVWLQ
jgi:sugar lactone lactonase YvrE